MARQVSTCINDRLVETIKTVAGALQGTQFIYEMSIYLCTRFVHVSSVRYEAELAYVRAKQERLRIRGEDLGREVAIYAAGVLSSSARAAARAATSSGRRAGGQGSAAAAGAHEEVDPASLAPAVAWRCLLECHAASREAFEKWMTQRAARHAQKHGLGKVVEVSAEEEAAEKEAAAKAKLKAAQKAKRLGILPPPEVVSSSSTSGGKGGKEIGEIGRPRSESAVAQSGGAAGGADGVGGSEQAHGAFVDGSGGDRTVLALLHGSASPSAQLDQKCYEHRKAWMAAYAARAEAAESARAEAEAMAAAASADAIGNEDSTGAAAAAGGMQVAAAPPPSSRPSEEVKAALAASSQALDEMHAAVFQDLRVGFTCSEDWPALMSELKGLRGGHHQAGNEPSSSGQKRMEVDAHGIAHAAEDSDRWVDSDAFSPGSVQRVHAELVEGHLMALLHFANVNMRKDQGEVAVLRQYVMQMACVHPQRVWRGRQGRTKAKAQGAYFQFVARTAAALELQRFFRASAARTLVATMNALDTDGMWADVQKVEL